MAQSLTNFNAALKEVYAPGLRNAINNSNVAWAEATRNDLDIIGEEAVWSIHKGRSSSTGARAELAALPTADRQRYAKPRRKLSFQYHTVKVSGQAKHLTRSDEGAFARALEAEMKGAEVDMKNDLSRQVFGQSKAVVGTGVIATVNGVPAANVITLDDDGVALDASIMRHFFVGELVDSIIPGTGAVRQAGMEIVAINTAARTITVNASGTTADNDHIVRAGNAGNELDGLRFLLGTASYAGIDPAGAGNGFWQATQVGSLTTGISEVLLDEAVESVETDGDGNTPELFIAEHAQRRKLASQLQAQKRYDGREMTLTSGWRGLSLARGVLVADRYCPTTRIFGIYVPELTKFVGLDFQFDEDDGEVFFKALDGSDAVEARFKGYCQLATTNRNSHVQVRVQEPTF